MPPLLKHVLIWMGAILVIFLLLGLSQGGMNEELMDKGHAPVKLVYSDFLNKVENGEVRDVVLRESADTGTRIQGHLNSGESFVLQAVSDAVIIPMTTTAEIAIRERFIIVRKFCFISSFCLKCYTLLII